MLFAVVLSLFLADVGPPRESEAFARARAGDLAASTRMLSDLLEAHPGSERACLWQERIFLNEAAQGDPVAMWGAAEALIAGWRASHWPADAGGLARVCRDDVAATLRHLAARWHRESHATCDRVRFALAEQAYRTYLAQFPDAPDAHTVAFYLGMLLVDRADLGDDPVSECGLATCGNPAQAARERRRERGEPAPRCGAFAPTAGEMSACPWLRAAQAAFLDALARDPDGPHAATAAYVQLSLAASITNHQERERTDLCRSNRDGVCVVEGTSPRGPACFEPTAACLVHLTHPDRWPTAALHGFMIKRPIGWAP